MSELKKLIDNLCEAVAEQVCEANCFNTLSDDPTADIESATNGILAHAESIEKENQSLKQQVAELVEMLDHCIDGGMDGVLLPNCTSNRDRATALLSKIKESE